MLLLLLALLLTACAAPPAPLAPSAPITLTVSAASDLTDAFGEIGQRYTAETGQQVVFNFGSSGQLAQQIAAGAPADVFASADRALIGDLQAQGRVLTDTVQLYALGRLALWVRADSPITPTQIADLARPEIRRIAIANPQHAPYGAAARQALTSAGLWETVQPKLVLAENVRQALQYAETGNTDVALVALSLALGADGRWTLVPETAHRPLEQALAVIAGTPHEHAARAFAAFVNGPRGRTVLRRYGLLLPGETLGDAPGAPAPAAASFNAIWPALRLSLQVTLVASVLIAVGGLALALLLARRRFPGHTVVETLVNLPLVLPPTVLGYYLLLFLGHGGPLARWLGADVVFTWLAAAIASAIVGLPLMVGAARAAIASVDPALENAARTLGSTRWQVLYRVTLPLARRGILAGMVLGAARALGEFGATLMVAGNIPGRTQTLPLAIYDAVQSRQYGLANAMALTMTALAFGSLWAVRRFEAQRSLPATAAPPSPPKPGGKVAPPRVSSRSRGPDAAPPRLPSLGEEVTARPISSSSGGPGGAAAPRLRVEIETRLPGFHLRVSLAVADEIVVLFGPSGAGKTTTLNAIAGLLTPDSGEITLDGRLLFRRGRGGSSCNVPARDRRVGYVFQGYALFPHLTALQNAAYPLWRQRDGTARALASLERMHLAHLAGRYPRELSGGQQQRVAIARALAAEPRLLLLDEPFSALDVAARERLQHDLAVLQAELALPVIYVTHRLEDALAMGHRLAVLRDGEVAQAGPIEEVFRRPASYDVAEIMGIRNLFRARVVGSGPGGLILDWDGLQLTAPAQATSPAGEVPGYIRPEDIKILYPDRPLTRAVADNLVRGRVLESQMGTGWRAMRVALPNGHAVDLRFPETAYSSLRLAPGAEITLALRRDALVVLERTPAAAENNL